MINNSIEVTKEYETYNYLDSDSWKTELPSVSLVASSKELDENPKVSVVIANYNNAPYLKRMMDSLVTQTIGIHNLQILFMDDQSPDESLEIVKPYTKLYPNIEIYRLDQNTGGAHGPRNAGLLKVRGEYIAILDADDWYAPEGLEILANLLDESGDGIVFAGVARSRDNILELTSPAYIDQATRNRDINDLPYEFYNWLGPQGNMVRTDIVKEHNLHFIDQKVADDVSFFTAIMRISGTISQDPRLTTYINRDEDNESLSRGMNESFFTSWLRALGYIKKNNEMTESLELFLSRRLEWLVIDFALRWDTGYGFSVEKVAHFKDAIDQYMGELPFDPSQYFKTDARKIAWRALQEENYTFLKEFVEWHSLWPVDKRKELIDGVYYYVPDNPALPKVKVNVTLKGRQIDVQDGALTVDFSLYTDETFNHVELRNVANPLNRYQFSADKVSDYDYQMVLTKEAFAKLDAGHYEFFVITDDYNEHVLHVNDINAFIKRWVIVHNADGKLTLVKPEEEKAYYLAVDAGQDVSQTVSYQTGDVIETYHETFSQGARHALVTANNDEIDLLDLSRFAQRLPLKLVNKTVDLQKSYYLEVGLFEAAQLVPAYTSLADVDLQRPVDFIAKSERIFVKQVQFTPKNEVVLLTTTDLFLVAKRAYFVPVVNHAKPTMDQTITVTINKKLFGYPSPEFILSQRLTAYNKGQTVEIIDIAFTKNGTPRYRLANGEYITARSEHVLLNGTVERVQPGDQLMVSAEKIAIYWDNSLKIKLPTTLHKGTLIKVHNTGTTGNEVWIEISKNTFMKLDKTMLTPVDNHIHLEDYVAMQGEYVVLSKQINAYTTPQFKKKNQVAQYKQGQQLQVVDVTISQSGIPRLKLENGYYVTANIEFVQPVKGAY